MKSAIIACALAVFAHAPVLAQGQGLTPSRFSETIRTHQPVAGELLHAVHLGAADRPVELQALSVPLPPGGYSHLCLKIETQDGTYHAEADFDITDVSRGRDHALLLRTQHRRLLESHSIRDVSWLAFVSNDCEGLERLYVPIQWKDDAGVTYPFLLLVNARTPSIDVRVFDRSTRRYFQCAKDRTSERLGAYDTECFVDLKDGPRISTLIVVRNRNERRLEDVALEIYVP